VIIVADVFLSVVSALFPLLTSRRGRAAAGFSVVALLATGCVRREVATPAAPIAAFRAARVLDADLSKFALTCRPPRVRLPQRSLGTITCTVTSLGQFTGAVGLVQGSRPRGVGLKPFVSRVTVPAGGSTSVNVDVYVSASAAVGRRTFELTATSADEAEPLTGQLEVIANPARVRVIYLVPADRSPRHAAVIGMQRAIRHLQVWYRNALGTGKTFMISFPSVRVVQTSHPASWYATNAAGSNRASWFWDNTLRDGFQLTGGRFHDSDDIWVYYIDAAPAPGQTVGATARVAVLPSRDVRGVAGGDSAQGICRWVGGLGHELGHAFGLSHPPDRTRTALMWTGMRAYPRTALTASDKQILGRSPFFADLGVTTRLFDCASLTSP
jgi:hypothetical protein